MDKEDILHICKGILLNHNRNEFESVASDVDEPRACYTE